VVLECGGQTFVQSATGDGPVAAAYEAIDQITGLRGHVIDYVIHSVTRGRDAVGEVFVHVDFEGRMFTGKAASTDIVDASARAYLHAVNKVLYANQRRTAQVGELVESVAQISAD
jgi:2-isopropylmalate synthase